MAKASEHDRKLIVKILWAGSNLGQTVRRLDRVRSVRAGRGLFSDIRSAVWPLLDDLVLMEREQGRLFLNSDLPWDGVIANGSDVTTFDSSKPTRKSVEITRQTTASLRIDDLSIVIRVGNLFPSQKDETKLASQYRDSPLKFVCDNSTEWRVLAAAAFASIVLTLAFVGGLKKRNVSAEITSASIPARMLIPFIAPYHFETAPAVIQDKLDRFNFVRSVTRYYGEFTDMLLNHSAENRDPMLFSESHLAYQRAFDEQRKSLLQLTAAQDALRKDAVSQNRKMLSLPVAFGESAEGSLQRILDKSKLVRTNAVEVTQVRRTMGTEFTKDPAYDHSAGDSDGGGRTKFQESMAAIAASATGSLPEEDLQKAQARLFATDAANAQISLFGEGLGLNSKACCKPNVAIKAGSSPISWEALEGWGTSDLVLAGLKASTWGAPVEEHKRDRITEPMAGVVDQRAVEQTIASGKFQLQLCFELALRRNQAAQGSMEWKWQLDTRGQITGLSLLKSSIKDEELTHCVREKIAQWKFPKSRGGRVEIRYPFEFIRDKG